MSADSETKGRKGSVSAAYALSDEIQHGCYLVARHIELLHDVVDAEIFDILDDGGDGQPGALEHSGTGDSARDALDGLALGPTNVSFGFRRNVRNQRFVPLRANPIRSQRTRVVENVRDGIQAISIDQS